MYTDTPRTYPPTHEATSTHKEPCLTLLLTIEHSRVGRADLSRWSEVPAVPFPEIERNKRIIIPSSAGIIFPNIFSIFSSASVLRFTFLMGEIIWIFLFIFPSLPTPILHVRCPLHTNRATNNRHGLVTCLAYPHESLIYRYDQRPPMDREKGVMNCHAVWVLKARNTNHDFPSVQKKKKKGGEKFPSRSSNIKSSSYVTVRLQRVRQFRGHEFLKTDSSLLTCISVHRSNMKIYINIPLEIYMNQGSSYITVFHQCLYNAWIYNKQFGGWVSILKLFAFMSVLSSLPGLRWSR